MMKRSSFLIPALVLVACAGAPPEAAVSDTAVVLPTPTSSESASIAAAPAPVASAAPMATPTVAPTAALSPTPTSAPVDPKTCRPKPPAVTFDVKNDDVVIPIDAAGCPLGESHFKANGYSYQASVAFVTEIQRLLRAGDTKGLSALANYPLRVNLPKGAPLIVKDAAGFVRDFDRIYPKAVIAAILAADPRDLFANAQGVMLGNGVLWSDNAKGHLGVIAVNVP